MLRLDKKFVGILLRNVQPKKKEKEGKNSERNTSNGKKTIDEKLSVKQLRIGKNFNGEPRYSFSQLFF